MKVSIAVGSSWWYQKRAALFIDISCTPTFRTAYSTLPLPAQTSRLTVLAQALWLLSWPKASEVYCFLGYKLFSLWFWFLHLIVFSFSLIFLNFQDILQIDHHSSHHFYSPTLSLPTSTHYQHHPPPQLPIIIKSTGITNIAVDTTTTTTNVSTLWPSQIRQWPLLLLLFLPSLPHYQDHYHHHHYCYHHHHHCQHHQTHSLRILGLPFPREMLFLLLPQDSGSQIQWLGHCIMPFADTSSRFLLHLEYNTIQIILKTFTVLCHWVLMMSLITFFQALIYTSRLVLLACFSITGPSYSFTVGMVAVPESTAVLATDCGSAITAPGLRPRPHETSAFHQDHL